MPNQQKMVTNDQLHEQIWVVGAGIVGLTSALQLQSQGYQVTIVDKKGVAAGASQGNAGHFATAEIFPHAEASLLFELPKMLLDPLGPIRILPRYFLKALPWFSRFVINMLPNRRLKNTNAIKGLNYSAIHEMRELAQSCNCANLIVTKGSLLVFEQTPLPKVIQQWRRYADEGVPVRLLTGNEARELEPSLSFNIQHALFFTETAHTKNPKFLCEAFAATFIERGGKILQAELDDIDTIDKLSLKYTSTDNQAEHMVNPDKILLTTGAWSKKFTTKLGYNVPLDTERGYHLMLPNKIPLNRPVTSFERKFIITPMNDGTRLAGMVEFGGLHAPKSKGCTERFLVHGKAIIPMLNVDEPHNGIEWMGFRPSLPDSLPVLGKTKHSSVFVSFGHQHLGLTWSALTAKLVAQQITGRTVDIDMKPYSIERF
ncbi:FAD-binding oxidoreductase [Parashewanella spongiae]|nr:FAD-dependent oxidoreductase [Parashewanella spongiae]MCL1079329.1 FAD-binding oxidoreductase [Parashewanella spongiae]